MSSGLFPEFALLITNLYAPAGTRIPMQQSNPPLGWTSDSSATMTDCSMRINSGTGGSTGGSTVWSAWNFGGTFGVNAFTISVAQLPAHSHGVNDPGHSHAVNDPGHTHSVQRDSNTGSNSNSITANNGISIVSDIAALTSATTGLGIFGSTTGITTQNAGSGSSISPNYTTPQVKYADHIIAVKS